MDSDKSLIEQLKAGNCTAYEHLVERFEAPLYRFFLCHHRNHHTAQEQTAETFAQLVQSFVSMRGGCEQLRAYVFATARHVLQRRWRQATERLSSFAEASSVSDPSPSPVTLASDREQLERVLNVISKFEEPERSVLLLRFVECYSINEIALALKLPLGTIKSHIHRSRSRLKQIFAEKE